MQQPQLPFIQLKQTEVRVAPFEKRKRIINDDDCGDPVVVFSTSSAPNASASGPADAQLLLQQQLIGPTATSDLVHDDGCSAIDVSSDSGEDLLVAPAAFQQPSPASVVDASASSAPNVSGTGPPDAQLISQQQLIGPIATSDLFHDDGCSAVDVSSDSGSSDEDDPVSRKARKLAVRIAQHRQAPFSAKTLKDYFGPISCEEYICNLDNLTQTCIMDLRFVVPVTNAHNLDPAIGGSLSASTSGSSSSSEGGSSSPKKLKNGYVIDDFIVDTDDGSCSPHSGSDDS